MKEPLDYSSDHEDYGLTKGELGRDMVENCITGYPMRLYVGEECISLFCGVNKRNRGPRRPRDCQQREKLQCNEINSKKGKLY